MKAGDKEQAFHVISFCFFLSKQLFLDSPFGKRLQALSECCSWLSTVSVLSPTLCNSPGCCKDFSSCSFCVGFQIPHPPGLRTPGAFCQVPVSALRARRIPKSEPRPFVLPSQILSITPFPSGLCLLRTISLHLYCNAARAPTKEE